ncbi:hypothetical protein quinque_012067 [Culex quinquefasciatus]
MNFINCCRLCLKDLVVDSNFIEEFFSIDELISDDRTLQQVVTECFQILFTENETITKVCEQCAKNVQLVYRIRKTIHDTDDTVKTYYCEIDDKSNIEILDIVTEESVVMQDENSCDTNPEPVKLETNDSPNQLNPHLETEYHIEPTKKTVKKVKTKTTKPARSKPAYTCYICTTDFATLNELDLHLPSHIGISQECHLCNLKVTTVRHLNNHLQRLHFRTGKRIPCQECQDQGSAVEFSSNFKLRDHILRVHRGIVGPPERKFICSYCGKKFSRSSHLKSHENDVHTKAIVFKCNYCTKFTATSRCSLLRHERTHTAEKPFKCDECGAAFNQSNAVKLHKTLKHSDERPYQCTFCDATFKGKYVLKRHLELHEQKNDVRKRSPRGVRQKRIRKKVTEADPSSEN